MNEVVQLPAFLQSRARTGLSQSISQGLSAGSPPTLSIKSQRFTLIDAAGNAKPLPTLYVDVVIVHANPSVSKLYYDKPYDPNATEFEPPACFSDNGIGPSRQSAKPQSATCAVCPHNVWGSNTSRITGKATKECNDLKKIAVVMPENPDMAFLLRVPPNSLKHLGAYVKTISAQNGGTRPVEVSDVVTRITFDPQVQGTLNFAPVAWVDEKTVVAMEKIWAAKSADDLVGINDTVHTGAPQVAPPQVTAVAPQQLPPPPQPQAQAPQPATMFSQSPAPAPSAPPQAEAPQTPRRRGRPAKEAAPPAQVPTQAPFMPAATQMQPVDDIPDFLKRKDPAAQAVPAAPAFGMVANPPAPSQELMAALDSAMNLKLPG